MEQAQRQVEQARARERAAREAREREARERQRAEQQRRLREQMQRDQIEQRQRTEQQRRLQEQLSRQRQYQERLKQLQIKDKPIEPSLISPLDLIIGGFAARGVRAGGAKGVSFLAKAMNHILARRSSSVLRVAAQQLVTQSHQATGRVVVNLVGTGEVSGAINVNNLAAQQVKGVPNLLRAAVERVGEIFPKGSVDKVVSNNVIHGTVDWATTARGCFEILRSGGEVTIAPYVAGHLSMHLSEIVNALRAAGFRGVTLQLGKFVTAVKP